MSAEFDMRILQCLAVKVLILAGLRVHTVMSDQGTSTFLECCNWLVITHYVYICWIFEREAESEAGSREGEREWDRLIELLLIISSYSKLVDSYYKLIIVLFWWIFLSLNCSSSTFLSKFVVHPRCCNAWVFHPGLIPWTIINCWKFWKVKSELTVVS